MKHFSMSQALKFGFSAYFDNIGYFLANLLIYAVLTIVLYAISGLFGAGLRVGTVVFLGIISIVGSFFIELFYDYKIIQKVLSICLSYPAPDLLHVESTNFLEFAGAQIRWMIKVMLASLLFFIPGIYLYYKYYFTGYFVINNNILTDDDHLRNAQLTQGIKFELFLFSLVRKLISLALCVGVITILLLPALSIARAHVFCQLTNPHDSIDEINKKISLTLKK